MDLGLHTAQVETTLEPLELLDQLQDIESTMGRKKLVSKGPRNIDLDILLYEDQTVNHERLKIPHAGIPEREFVLRPLAECVRQLTCIFSKYTPELILQQAHTNQGYLPQ